MLYVPHPLLLCSLALPRSLPVSAIFDMPQVLYHHLRGRRRRPLHLPRKRLMHGLADRTYFEKAHTTIASDPQVIDEYVTVDRLIVHPFYSIASSILAHGHSIHTQTHMYKAGRQPSTNQPTIKGGAAPLQRSLSLHFISSSHLPFASH